MSCDAVQSTWSDAVDDIVAEVLERAQFTGLPVDAILIAHRIGVTVAVDRSQAGRGRHKRMAGQPAIFLSPDDRPERLQWAAAHELGEMFACEAFQRAGVEADTSEPGLREQVANLFASHLLLPSRSFFNEVRCVAGDLLELKAIFATASHELIAMRLLDLPEPSIVTIFDQGKVTRRRSSTTSHAPQLQQTERDCWSDIHHHNRPSERSADDFTVRGWPVHEPGWKREILRTVAHECEW